VWRRGDASSRGASLSEMTLPISECRSGAIILALVRRPTQTTDITLETFSMNPTLFARL